MQIDPDSQTKYYVKWVKKVSLYFLYGVNELGISFGDKCRIDNNGMIQPVLSSLIFKILN